LGGGSRMGGTGGGSQVHEGGEGAIRGGDGTREGVARHIAVGKTRGDSRIKGITAPLKMR